MVTPELCLQDLCLLGCDAYFPVDPCACDLPTCNNNPPTSSTLTQLTSPPENSDGRASLFVAMILIRRRHEYVPWLGRRSYRGWCRVTPGNSSLSALVALHLLSARRVGSSLTIFIEKHITEWILSDLRLVHRVWSEGDKNSATSRTCLSN